MTRICWGLHTITMGCFFFLCFPCVKRGCSALLSINKKYVCTDSTDKHYMTRTQITQRDTKPPRKQNKHFRQTIGKIMIPLEKGEKHFIYWKLYFNGNNFKARPFTASFTMWNYSEAFVFRSLFWSKISFRLCFLSSLNPKAKGNVKRSDG